MTHVLIVEDHEENRTLLKMLLEANGYRVTAAGDGLEALAAARRDPPDAIVSDTLMPKMDGFTLCRAWTQDAALKAIPFIFYSATYVQPEDEQFAVALGAVRYLIKPLEAEVFLRELRAVLQQWAGRAAPGPAAPLDDAAAHALHESALARKLDDKMAQLEAANRKLQESEARFRSLSEMSSDFYWETDAEHRLIARGSANKDLSTATAFRGGVQIGERRWEIPYLSPDAAGWAAHRAVLDAHQAFRNFELSRLGIDDNEHFVSINGDPVFDTSGAFMGYRGVGTDITERKQAEARLRDSEQRHRSIVETSLDGFWILDTGGHLLEVNDAYCRLIGYEREELLHMRVADVEAMEDPAATAAHIRGVMAKGYDQFETRHRHKNGHLVDIDISAKFRPDLDGGCFFVFLRDITGRKRAENALRESEDRYRDLVENSQDLICTHDLEGKLLSVNAAAARLTGYSREALLRMNMADLLTRGARDGFAAYLAEIRAKGAARGLMQIRTADGKTRWWEYHNTLRTGGVATPVVRGMAQDITERKLAESALQESETSFRSLFDGMLNGFAYCRMQYDERDRPVDFVYLKVNDAFERLTGLKNVVGRNVSDVIPGIRELSPEIFEIYGRVASTGVPETFEFDFKPMAMWLTISVYSPQTGYFVAIFDDITERKRAEEELRARELRYAAVAASATDAFVTSDAAGRIVGWNASAERIFGYAEAEVMGQPLTLLIPQRFQERHLDGMKRVQSGGERRVIGKTAELAGRRKDASEFPLELSLAEWSVGEGRFFTGVIRDITERKAAEANIQRLTQLYAALSQCNQAIVRCTSEEELFPQICRVAVQFGGMKMAWIGMVDPDTRKVRIAASFGDRADEYLQGIEISVVADSPLGRGSSGVAIRENRPVWQQDFQNEPITAPWHERRARFAFGASATLPLQRNGVPSGVLALYAAEAGAFDEAARELLAEMATDIGFALDNFAREAARARAEQDLRTAEEQFRGLVEQSIAGIYLIQDGKFAYVNPRFAEIFGYASVDELVGRESISLVAEKCRSAVLDARRQVEVGAQSVSYAFTALRKNGDEIEVGVHSSRAAHNRRPALIGLMQDISEKKRAEEQIQRYAAQIENAFMSTVQVVTTLGEMRDPYTGGHQRKVAEIAVAIGAELGFDARRLEGLRVAGYLHDIGKIMIPSEILSKPGKLSPTEFQLVQGHAQASYDVLKDVAFPWPVAEVALQHHERIDGSGYPQGLKGEAILLEARILAVADVIEAMSSHRPYRPGFSIEVALSEIERGRGSAYDPIVVDGCLKLFREKSYALPA
jgi:PAS domain S-box-containing protein